MASRSAPPRTGWPGPWARTDAARNNPGTAKFPISVSTMVRRRSCARGLDARADDRTPVHRRSATLARRYTGTPASRLRNTCSARSLIAEPEPGLAAQRRQGVQERPALVAPPPAQVGVGQAREGVEDRVEIGRDRKAQVLEIVAGVARHQQSLAQTLGQTQRQLGAADTAAERHDLAHLKRSMASGRTRSTARPSPSDAPAPRINTTGVPSARLPHDQRSRRRQFVGGPDICRLQADARSCPGRRAGR